MSKIKISQDLKSKRLTVNDKQVIYNLLLDNSGLKEKRLDIETSIRDYLEKLLVENVIDPEFFKLFQESKRIANKQNLFTIRGKDLNLTDESTNYFPNNVIKIVDYDEKLHSKFQMILTVNTNIDFPPEFRYLDDWVSKIPENKLDILKDLFIEYCNVTFQYVNFLSEYKSRGWNRQFLPDIVTWGSLYNKHYDWFKVLYDYSDIRELLTKKDKGLSNEEEIKNVLLNLKSLLFD